MRVSFTRFFRIVFVLFALFLADFIKAGSVSGPIFSDENPAGSFLGELKCLIKADRCRRFNAHMGLF